VKDSWRRFIPTIFLSGLAAVQFLCVPGQYIGKEDGALYVLASRSILEGAYTLGVSPGFSKLTFLTPGWPLLLTPAALLSGESPAGYHVWAWAWLVLCDALLWFWLRRRLRRPAPAYALTALFALNPLVLSRAGAVMCELPFLAIVLLTLVLLEREKSLPGWAAGLFCAGAWLVRPAALPFFPAVGGVYLCRKRWRDAVLWAACALTPLALWQVWVSAAGGGVAEAQELSITLLNLPLSRWPHVAFHNMREAAVLLGLTFLPFGRGGEGWTAIAGVLGAMLCGGGILGHCLRLRREGYDGARVFFLLSLAMHALWPWWFERYLPPLLPFIFLGLWELLPDGISSRSWAPPAFAMLAALALPSQGPALVRRAAAGPRPELAETYDWVRKNTPEQALFMSALYSRDAYYTGRPFVPPPDRSKGETELAVILRKSGVRYVLWTGVPDLGSSLGEGFQWARSLQAVDRALRDPGFERVHGPSSDGAIVYRVRPGETKVTADSP